MNRELETDGVPAPSEFELVGARLTGERAAEFKLISIEAWQMLLSEHVVLVDENKRLRGALEKVDELLEHLQSVEELLKKSWNINKTRQWIATALAPHECAGDYCEACDKCVGA